MICKMFAALGLERVFTASVFINILAWNNKLRQKL
jgi:hypothetical protein